MKRKATAVWRGSGVDGRGTLTTPSGVFDEQPYSFKMRFDNESGRAGTNPEELIAAAHSGCFSMALAVQLSNAGFEAERLHTEATVTLNKIKGGFEISSVHLELVAKVPGIEEDQFMQLAEGAKENCPVSQVLNAEITLEAHLRDA